MAVQKSEAIVLKTCDFRETSLIINFFTKDFGKINGLIKGIRNEPQRYGGLPLIFSRNLIVFYERPRRDLNLVTQCDAKEQFLPIRENLEKINYANYFVELLGAVTQDYDRNEELFGLAIESMRSLCENKQSWQIARIFEIRLLKLSGFKPRLDACVNCQREIAAQAPLDSKPPHQCIGGGGKYLTGQGRFSSLLGGILCARCLNLDKSARPMLKGTLASIDYIEKSSWQKAFHLKLSSNIASELAKILSNFLEIHLDKEIKSRKFLNYLELKEELC